MQTTNVSAYSLKLVLEKNVKGIKVAGYTVKPGYSNGLILASSQYRIGCDKGFYKIGDYVGF